VEIDLVGAPRLKEAGVGAYTIHYEGNQNIADRGTDEEWL